MRRFTKKLMVLFLAAGVTLAAGCGGNDGGSQKAGGGEKEEVRSVGQGDESVDREAGLEEGGRQEAEKGAKEAEGDKYTWQEITVALPAGWEGRCVMVENEGGFSIFQKASYEKDSALGYLCGFFRTREPVEYGSGETLIAYTEDKTLYYLVQPLDVACDTEDEKIAGEYLRMCQQVPQLKASAQFAVSGIRRDSEDCVLAASSILPLDREMLANLSDNDLWIGRNEIYARHGRQFANEYLQQHFNRCTWYEGNVPAGEFQESVLSQIEKDNVQLLLAAEQEYDRRHPYPKKYQASGAAAEDLSGDGGADEIRYQVAEQENGQYQCIITVNGETYDASELSEYESEERMMNPVMDFFYVTDILESDDMLEIAVVDEGPSEDFATYFFQYDGTLSCIGRVPGTPFADMNGGFNGFSGAGGIRGQRRIDLIETAEVQDYWWYTHNRILDTNYGWYDFVPAQGHILYEDLIVHYERDESSDTLMIPAQEVFFLSSDGERWILVKGKDGSLGYMLVENGMIVDLNKAADQVFSDLRFSD